MKEFYENQHILNLQAYYIPTYLDFSHADLENADFSQSKKTHMPRTCCILKTTIEAICQELKQIFRYDPEKVIKVYIGVNGDDIDTKDLKNKEYSVVSVIKHKGWVGSHVNPHDDIALIKLARKVKFKVNNGGLMNSILPACLPSPKIRSQLYNTKAFVAGNRYVHCLICM